VATGEKSALHSRRREGVCIVGLRKNRGHENNNTKVPGVRAFDVKIGKKGKRASSRREKKRSWATNGKGDRTPLRRIRARGGDRSKSKTRGVRVASPRKVYGEAEKKWTLKRKGHFPIVLPDLGLGKEARRQRGRKKKEKSRALTSNEAFPLRV